MKKVLLAALVVTVGALCANAQTVITNDYSSSPISGEVADNSGRDAYTASAELVYYSFDGFENYGISVRGTNPNAFGFEMNLRACFDEPSCYNFDLGLNYSFLLWQNDDMRLMLTAAVGPSIGMREVYNDKGKTEDKTKFDLFGNARLGFAYKRLAISAGYFIWGLECKFSKEYKADGFSVGIGYAF